MVVTYADGSSSRLALRNPETWWPIEQDYFIDDFQFPLEGPLPPRVDLKTGKIRILDAGTFKGRGREIPGRRRHGAVSRTRSHKTASKPHAANIGERRRDRVNEPDSRGA